VGHELGRALLLSDAVTPDAMAQALLASVRDRVSLVRALLATGAIAPTRLEEELARTAPDEPVLRHPVPVLDLVERLPPHLCSALVAVPVRADAMTGTIDVAVADASDTHAAEEIAFYLSAPVRVLRSPLGALESAIDQVKHAREAKQSSMPPTPGPISVPPPSPVRPVMRTPPWGSPAFSSPAAEAVEPPERPLPLVSRTATMRLAVANGVGKPADEAPKVTEAHAADIPVPLLRRLTPGAGLVALARAAQELDEEEDPVVELRNPKPSSLPPHVLANQTAPVAPPPLEPPLPAEKPVEKAPPRSLPEVQAAATRALPAVESAMRSLYAEDRSITQPTTTLNQLLREMTKVTARDPLMELVLIAVRPVAHKSALFAVKKDTFAGFMCTDDFGDRHQLTQVQIDARKPSLLSTTAAAGTYMGPLPRNDVHAPLAKFIKSREPEILGVAIKAAGRPALLLIAHEIVEPLKTMSVLTEVARIAGEQLEKIVRAKR
jgi:hypothetical protein